jgi:hypothetical protein
MKGEHGSCGEPAKGIARTLNNSPALFSDTAASARCYGTRGEPKLFQQLSCSREKPLKRLAVRVSPYHRAEATVSLKISVCLLALLLLVLPASAQPKAEIRRPAPLDIAQAEREGRELVASLLAQVPEGSVTNTGALAIRKGRAKPAETRARFEISYNTTNWTSVYRVEASASAPSTTLTIVHEQGRPNRYELQAFPASDSPGANSNAIPATRILTGDAAWIPLAGSDFWIADLGLEFLQWPQQRVLSKEMRRSRACTVLESVPAQPIPGGYAKIVSWIDNENHGVIHADAYDASTNKLKEFNPTGVEKVNGRYELEGIEIRNVQKDTQSTITFDLSDRR